MSGRMLEGVCIQSKISHLASLEAASLAVSVGGVVYLAGGRN